MKKKNKVSVVITAYNSEKYIKKAVQSIINQTYKNWELIIVNDNSIDGTLSLIKKFKNKKIKIINLQKNLGPYKATDLALKICKGEYIAILDSDDYSHKNRLKIQVTYLNRYLELGLVGTYFHIINENNKIVNSIKSPADQDNFNKIFPCQNLICNSSVMFRRDILKNIKFYNKYFYYSYDYHFYLKIFANYKIRIVKNFYTYYRFHLNQRTHEKKLKSIIYKENLMNLDWVKKNSLINTSNLFLYYKNYLKNYLRLILNYFNFFYKKN